MRILLQRVKEAAVDIGGQERAGIGRGLLGLVGFAVGDTELPAGDVWKKLAAKVIMLRIFPDQSGKLNLSLLDFGGRLILVPQFTLYADCRKGKRPGFSRALPPEAAKGLFEAFVSEVAAMGCTPQTGVFGAEMDVRLVNWGPVTIILDSAEF
ncbi:MAG: D-aminoacyl-tRNA deacylase [Desulfonatronovibrionaceae bacterium]